MNILICSKLFFPQNAIGAVRVTNFAKYLNEIGHNITILTVSDRRFSQRNEMFNSDVRVERIEQSKIASKLIARVENVVQTSNFSVSKPSFVKDKKKRQLPKIYSRFRELRLQLYNLYLEFDWYYQTRKAIKKGIINNKQDIVISSFGPLGSYLVGRYIKKIKIADFWISDLRDNMQNEDYPKVINWIFSYFEKDILRKADAISVVSKGQLNMLRKSVGEKRFKNKSINVITNGYENEILPEKMPNQINVLKFVYTGALYNGKRDMSLLLEALKELLDEGKMDSRKIQLHYAGSSSNDLTRQAFDYGIQQIIKDHGYITRAEALHLQQSGDALLVLSWNTVEEQGILSGKFFEYLQSYKPVIAITSGNLPNSELSELVKELNVGIACEYVKGNPDLILLKDYLISLYNDKISGNQTRFEPKIEKIKLYHYRNIVSQLEKICVTLIKTRSNL